MESTEGVTNEDKFADKGDIIARLEKTKTRSLSYPWPPKSMSTPSRRVSSPLHTQQPPPVPARLMKPRPSTFSDKSLDLDTVPKTEKLNNQIVSSRPKVPHSRPSRDHIHKRIDDEQQNGLLPPWPVPQSKPPIQPSSTDAKSETRVPQVITTTPVSAGVSGDVVMQLKEELCFLKKEVESLKVLAEEVDSLKYDFKRDIEILRQDLDDERAKVSDLRVELEHLSKNKTSH